MATPSGGTVPLTGDPLIDGLTQGSEWTFGGGPQQLTYSLTLAPVGVGWSAAAAAAVDQALAAWAAVANITFVEVDTDSITQFNDSAADLTFSLAGHKLVNRLSAVGISDFPDPSGADGFRMVTEFVFKGSIYDASNYPKPEGDVFIENNYPGFNYLQPGGDGFETILHEIGHALGLKHPHDDGNGSHPTFAQLGIASKDDGLWTVMSYDLTSPTITAGNQATPMPLDILAIQSIYGANMTYHTGDDTYVLADDGIVSTIWDAGGTDTIDASGLANGLTIDLHEASFIHHGNPAKNHYDSITAIAYDVVIENAIGTNLADKILGNAAANRITANGGNDTLSGDAGNDTLDGGAGADKMTGGDGDDSFVVDNAKDMVTEASAAGGHDKVTSSISYTLGANVEDLILAAGASAALAATGNAANNLLQGNEFNNTLDGKAGADTMVGGLGDDVYTIDDPGDTVTENSSGGTDEIRTGLSLTTAVANVENYTFIGTTAVNFTGSALNNRITGTAANDTLTGGDGDDTLNGGGGADSLTGGKGNDSYFIDNAGDTIADTSGIDEVRWNLATSLTLGAAIIGIENVVLLGTAAINATGDDGANRLEGNDSANKLAGNGGNDLLVGDGGNDTLDGGTGTDDMQGGAGNDTYLVDAPGDGVTEAANAGIDLVLSTQSFILGDNLENLTLTGATGSEAIDGTGNALANVLVGNDGKNLLSAADANDTVSGAAGDDTLDGGAGSDSLSGGGGNDLLDGGTGADKMAGGDGDDTYVVDDAKDVVTEAAGAGHDTVKSSINYTLGPNLEDLVLLAGATNGTGNTVDNKITGNAAGNALNGLVGNDTLDGGGGNDTLDGGAGSDQLTGGSGDDVYVIDSIGEVNESAGDLHDEVRTSMALSGVIANIEDYTFTGTKAVAFTGDVADNEITGTKLADTLAGGDGNDTLRGGVGADSLDGGAGNDLYVIDSGGDKIADSGGVDAVQSPITYVLAAGLEDLTLTGTAAINGTGNGADNHLTGNAGVNKLDGGTGADTLAGGLGNDIYIVDDSKDAVTEAPNGGVDLVLSSALIYTLSGDVENLTLTKGAGDIAGTGNTVNNTLTGNEGDNTLNGGTGADTMSGGLGDDTYIVDNAKDVVTEAAGAGTGNDTIKASISIDLAHYANVENVTLTGTGALTGTGDSAANRLVGNDGANLLSGLGGDDTLEGGKGNDALIGGDGNNVLIGGAGNDHLDVSLGNDTIGYTSKLDGHDIVDGFDGNASGGQDVLDLDALFDSLGVAVDRAARVSVVDNGASVDVRIDADGNAGNGFELVAATLNAADAVTVGEDVLVGS